ncbi:dihydroorotase [Candidatus Nitrosocosmicus agrestis]|jgi:dihydropyrimidinase|uniref:dihydroorotase n=1 Tax=Candidatus Nitrosocosmicus agrestis TaxID=2563600 RepID=UPI00122E0623|nr:amidohydrolase family protein [Candidatus Nitrosocosmicus sp. SS]KAA2283609.1 amidohydrolase family protein [Candidatus Nitrosocosmicus sp. SS]KAF0869691.1 dihydroorotase [Candidatus Nitrosocosmicus sp. SS]
MSDKCDLLIKDAQAVIPKIGITKTNILIEDGKIKNLSSSIDGIEYTASINANNRYVLPGLIDPHVHYGVFSPIEIASETESRTAALGGVTTIMRMLRVYEPYTQEIEKQLQGSVNNHYIDYQIHASILNPQQVSDIPHLHKSGIRSFKLYMNLGSTDNRILMDMYPSQNNHLPRNVNITDELCFQVLSACSSLKNTTVLVHAEDHSTCARIIEEKKKESLGHAKKSNSREEIKADQKDEKNLKTDTAENYNPLKVWSECRPPISEEIAIKKIMKMGRELRSNIYFVHIGSNHALNTILNERQLGGCNAYIETCPHYLTHSIDYSNLRGKVVPPLRTKNDIASLWNAIKNGLVDTIGTDHVANTLALKYGQNGDIWTALAGFPGLATMLPVLLHFGVIQRNIPLTQIAELSSYNAAKIFGFYPKKGTIQKGSDADLVIIDLEISKKVTPELLQSSSDYTIYDGMELQGWPTVTISRGKIIMENETVYQHNKGHGKFLK